MLRRALVAVTLLFAGTVALLGATPGAAGAACGTTNVARGKTATASSNENGSLVPAKAVDGDVNTRWSSQFSDPQWLQVDLGTTTDICQVVITWQTSYARAFSLEVSPTGAAGSWTPIYSTTTNTGGTQTLAVSGSGRYIRMHGTQRATRYGYSIKEFAVYSGAVVECPPVSTDLGPNVIVFDPSMPASTIQARADQVFAEMESNQFGAQRYALAFKPGTYSGINVNTGFYTSVLGLGRNVDDVTINGDVTVDAGWFGGNATQNFWRSIENLAIVPSVANNGDRWAVAQAAPMRRVHIRGKLNLAPNGYGWASGGYIADSVIDGSVGPYSQQQWYTRDSRIGGWVNGVWNMVFSGVQGAPADSFPSPRYTTLATTPVIREKPYLYLNGDSYSVLVPNLRTNAAGTTWQGGPTPGTSIPLTSFYVVRPGASAATINAALACGRHLLFTPGIYHLDQTLNVTNPDTVVLGIGYPTLIPDNGVEAMRIADVDGVKVAGLLFDAGPVNSPALLTVGTAGSTVGHSANPVTIQDAFFRIGGAGPGKATTSLIVNSQNTIIDHIWAWRADHGSGVGWTTNTADHGLIVNGDDVSAYGLFVEHYQKDQVIWNGQRGRTIFFQNEMPYDPPSQSGWRTGARGYAAYKVADTVTAHEAWGMGSYCNFTTDPSIVAEHGFETPVNPNVRFHHLLTVSLGGKGTIAHVVNDTGGPAQGTQTVPVEVVSYP
ncbi:discoidin domain-containing protein [Dactylosporangium sp. AC04546]|uniref:discoidin domain-containing protein n=1 Tax=Dactylosporangium sp. AC04546 TaxID=2862460 RepID=UPI001EE146A6|nr:discoidin domain-containing protein [Dactylosporangium sp. AC04546]WVK87932.1 discoidin domain-containing protein [Dactylosporangium sp. AC04546]